MSRIIDAIAEFDGKHTQPLKRITVRQPNKVDLKEVAELMGGDRLEQYASTWILLGWLKNGLELSESYISDFVESAVRFQYWEGKLHFAQSLEYLQFNKDEAKDVFKLMKKFSGDDNKFLRAWSINGAWLIAKTYPEFRAVAVKLVNEGLEDDAASVRARARNIIKDIDNN